MATGNKTLLCIDRDPSELRVRKQFLKKNGYRVVTATDGYHGLRMCSKVGVDAIVVGYYLGLMDGPLLAAAMKQVRPEMPIVLLADVLEMPEDALHTVDAVVTKSDGPRFLLSTLESVLDEKLAPSVPDKCMAAPKFDCDQQRAIADLKSLIQTLPPEVRQQVITELRSFFLELAA
jgi:CheY-like chemotaxis protein